MRRVLGLCLLVALAGAEPDPYLEYVRTAEEFRQVEPIEPEAWDTWVYMPWYYKWTIGHDAAAGEFCRAHGINGGFTDHGRGPLPWLEKWGLRFYNDHTAGKGILHLRGAQDKSNFQRVQRDPRLVRAPALDAGTFAEAKRRIEARTERVRQSPLLVAYALDDEVSTGAFVVPLPWRLKDDDEAYRQWLLRYYGRPVEPQWVTPEFTRGQLDRPLRKLDFAPFLDRMSYNDSVWANFVGALVRYTNERDSRRPAGIVGCQNPSLWGGYDYAKLSRKLQFAEAYEMGSAPEILRSLTRGRAPLVLTHFHREDRKDAWRAWRYFAHGQRGMVGWVARWFDGERPQPWLAKFARTLKEIGGVQGPKLHGATWRHDGIAIYYSHPSIQVSWVLDSEPHGKTWPHRGDDDVLGTSHNVRRAWEYLLTDSGLQYDFVAYDEVIANGVPAEYDVLILPACFALSDVEARRIREFAARGGRVVADFMCGLFDQHGKGRPRGVLDDLFGVEHDGTETKRDFFGGELWVETDQEKGADARSWRDRLTNLDGRTRSGFKVAERRLKGPYVKGAAVYLNLSPQLYLVYRDEGSVRPDQRAAFAGALGKEPWVRARGARDLEVTAWHKAGRTYLFVVQNPTLGTDGKFDVKTGEVEVTLTFREKRTAVRDERTGEDLGEGTTFTRKMRRNEALLVSVGSGPKRRTPGR